MRSIILFGFLSGHRFRQAHCCTRFSLSLLFSVHCGHFEWKKGLSTNDIRHYQPLFLLIDCSGQMAQKPGKVSARLVWVNRNFSPNIDVDGKKVTEPNQIIWPLWQFSIIVCVCVVRWPMIVTSSPMVLPNGASSLHFEKKTKHTTKKNKENANIIIVRHWSSSSGRLWIIMAIISKPTPRTNHRRVFWGKETKIRRWRCCCCCCHFLLDDDNKVEESFLCS